MKRSLLVVLCLFLVVSILYTCYAENEYMTFDQIKDAVFNTMVDGERVFKYPSEMILNPSKANFHTKGAILYTFAGIYDGELQVAARMIVSDVNSDSSTLWEVEHDQLENVFDLIGDSLNEYIRYDDGEKMTFWMGTSSETWILFEYSPVIEAHSDKDIFKTQNYAEYDSFDEFSTKVKGVLIDAKAGGNPTVEGEEGKEEEKPVTDFKTLSKGSKGNEVVKLQNRLNELGYSVGSPDGDFGGKTQKAVEDFQKVHGLNITGVVDEETYNAIFAENDSADTMLYSDLVEFKSTMMDSVSEQISSATDLTITPDNRAVLAALLSLEFANQRPDFNIDYTLPIYVCKQGTIASVAIGGEKDYVLIIYQMNPLSTSYGIFSGNDASKVKAALDATNESVWQVPLDTYNEKLAALVDQIS